MVGVGVVEHPLGGRAQLLGGAQQGDGFGGAAGGGFPQGVSWQPVGITTGVRAKPPRASAPEPLKRYERSRVRRLEQASGRICIFAKPPRPGLSKTRLAATVGTEDAARLAAAFLADTVELALSTGAEVVLATTDPAASLDLAAAIPRWDQGEGDLGDRIERVLQRALREAPWAIALGADSPGLPAQALYDAIDGLRRGRAVLGPCVDGGFYLLGLPRVPEGLLRAVPWSTERAAAVTLQALADRGLAPQQMLRWFDIDVSADLGRFRAEVPERAAPHTWAALRDMGRDA